MQEWFFLVYLVILLALLADELTCIMENIKTQWEKKHIKNLCEVFKGHKSLLFQ